MSRTLMSPSGMDFIYQGCSEWSYAPSDARSEPIPSQRPFHQATSPSCPRPPPQSFPPLPTEIDKGVWLLEDDILYACDWPPVQHYLSQVRQEKRMVDPPSHLVWTLAALDVLYNPHDVAHWLFWSGDVYERHAKSVDLIALHKPRLIKSRVPWTGRLEYQSTVSQIQEKFVYVHVNRKWYPTEPKPDKRMQRTTRSTGEPTLITGKQFFGLDAACSCLVCTGSRKDNSDRKRSVTKPTPKKKSLKSPSRVPRKAPTPISVHDNAATDPETTIPGESSITALPVVRSKSQSPRPLPASAPGSSLKEIADPGKLSPPLTSSLSSASSSSSHSRSTSQSSVETLIGNSRCSSVESSDTVIDTSPSKKRKTTGMEKDNDNLAGEPESTERMVTRGRASKRRAVDSEESKLPSRLCTPMLEVQPTPARSKPRAKRARV